jgi:hypothetical protein
MPAVEHQIRLAAEAEERAFYNERASQAWLDALALLGTDADKSFIDRAPCLIVIFAQSYGMGEDGERRAFYAQESVWDCHRLFDSRLASCGVGVPHSHP